MKKIILALVLVVILVFTLPVFAASLKSYSWRLGYNTVEDSVRGVVANKFKEIVEKKTNGRITITNYPAEALGPAIEQVEAVKLGAQDFILLGSNDFLTVVPDYGLYAIPFLFSDAEEGLAFTRTEIKRGWDEKALAKGYKVIESYDLGFCQFTNNVKPIIKATDLQGLKMRCAPGSPFLVNLFEQFGAAVPTIPFSEVYMALQTGVADGQFNPIDAIYENKFHEVQKYLTIVNFYWLVFELMMTEKTWSSLDAEDQAILVDAAQQAREYAKDYTATKMEEYLVLLEDEFESIDYMTDEAKAEAREILKPIYTELQSEYDDFDKIQKWLEDYRSRK